MSLAPLPMLVKNRYDRARRWDWARIALFSCISGVVTVLRWLDWSADAAERMMCHVYRIKPRPHKDRLLSLVLDEGAVAAAWHHDCSKTDTLACWRVYFSPRHRDCEYRLVRSSYGSRVEARGLIAVTQQNKILDRKLSLMTDCTPLIDGQEVLESGP